MKKVSSANVLKVSKQFSEKNSKKKQTLNYLVKCHNQEKDFDRILKTKINVVPSIVSASHKNVHLD